MKIKYCLFPFSSVKRDAKIAIYGAGDIYRDFISQIEAEKYCNVLWIVDKKFVHQEHVVTDYNLTRSYISPEEMQWDEPDYIVVASLAFSNEMAQTLKDYGVDINRIVTVNKSNMLSVTLKNISKTPASVDWKSYYLDAEKRAGVQFEEIIKPFLLKYKNKIDYSAVMDFACGEGRIAACFSPLSAKLYVVDSSHSAIETCKDRFVTQPHVVPLCNASGRIPVEDNEMTFIYSWDAMVHFTYKSIDYYFSEFARVLLEGGVMFIHHSNLAAKQHEIEVFEQWNFNYGGRSNVMAEDIVNIAYHHGLEVLEQKVIDWGVPGLDCISVIIKPYRQLE
ncbi:class I SAM-dependent methyltransferase [Aeromonas salmonicida]|uniref:class I SAM-dependent methyltransferase n=1 Tax=Aeromonas salmonicida TaxID=645 RepID=UPI003440C346